MASRTPTVSTVPTVPFRTALHLCACAALFAAAPPPARAQHDARAGTEIAAARFDYSTIPLPGFDAHVRPMTAAAPANTSPVGALPLDAQVAWLQRAAQHGDLERLDDAQLIALFSSLDPLAVPRYIAAGPNGYDSYEFTMRRRERIHGQWPARPDHMLVRVSHDPLRIYAKWLPDGAHAGQEVMYDATTRGDAVYGHLGGLLRAVSIWTSVDGFLARTQSRHRVTDLGTEYIARRFLAEGERFARAGVAEPPRIGVETVDGVRVVTFTYTAPTGSTGFYADKETLGLDLRHPWFRVARSYDGDGRLFEDVVFEQVEPKTFDALTFDPKNPDYRF
ncbi:uncharacterized protein DUF1571 [Paraburkholderia caballeronis]|uniref:DUF1571 domain-containing protein n=1 Tax=Paraburkholderia caballeronis TaxID=416943 RepID=UPI0010649992|nr:DUF1571 domain-containing protein [Paraburkholderia caballeronis]TDV36177.1 uncharacterized protein DUF1571 [Paraburkholderia caballeronis]